jgi:hypothetical protein
MSVNFSAVRITAFATAFMLLSCSLGPKAQGGAAEITYEDIKRVSYERYSAQEMTGGRHVPKRMLVSQSDDVLLGEQLIHPIKDCSTTLFVCKKAWSRVFAVPRQRLVPNASFEVAGASFKVEVCLRGDVDVCQVALLSMTCLISEEAQCHDVGETPDSTSKAVPSLYYIYNEDFGVTSYGVTERGASNQDEMIGIAGHLVLQGKRGLLSGLH